MCGSDRLTGQSEQVWRFRCKKISPLLPCRTQLSSRPSRDRTNKVDDAAPPSVVAGTNMWEWHGGRTRHTAHSASLVVHDADEETDGRRERGRRGFTPFSRRRLRRRRCTFSQRPGCLLACHTAPPPGLYVAPPLHSGCHSLVNGPT